MYFRRSIKKMILHIYKAEPEYKMNYDCEDLDISKYEFCRTIITNYVDINDLIEAIEEKKIDFDFEESDLIELAPGSEELNNMQGKDNIGYKENCNYLIVYGLGVKQIALDGKELAFKRLSKLF